MSKKISKGQQLKTLKANFKTLNRAASGYMVAARAELEELRLKLGQAEDAIESYRRRAEEAEAALAVQQ